MCGRYLRTCAPPPSAYPGKLTGTGLGLPGKLPGRLCAGFRKPLQCAAKGCFPFLLYLQGDDCRGSVCSCNAAAASQCTFPPAALGCHLTEARRAETHGQCVISGRKLQKLCRRRRLGWGRRRRRRWRPSALSRGIGSAALARRLPGRRCGRLVVIGIPWRCGRYPAPSGGRRRGPCAGCKDIPPRHDPGPYRAHRPAVIWIHSIPSFSRHPMQRHRQRCGFEC